MDKEVQPDGIGSRLRTARDEKEWTREYVRDLLKERWGETVSTGKLEKWENGRNKADATWAARLADLYGEDLRWVFTVTDQRGVPARPQPSASPTEDAIDAAKREPQPDTRSAKRPTRP